MEEKLDIIYQTKIEMLSQKDVAVLYRVKPILVRQLVQRAKDNTNFLSELCARETLKRERKKLVVETASEMYSTLEGISKADDVV
jgi:hypothetical protein